MITLKDQLGHLIKLNSKPKRIISLVPSQTEFLFDLGLDKEVVGITKFCIHPQQWFKTKTRVGGTKTLNFDKIKSLKPDLIIANKEENTQSEIEYLLKNYTVYVSDISTLNEAYQMMNHIAQLTQKVKEGQKIIAEIKQNFKDLPQFNIKALYMIWRSPYMVAGRQTFINHLLNQIDIKNCISDKKSRYIEVNDKVITESDLDYIFLSSEPYPFKNKHIEELKKISKAKPILVDGEIFSWYGSRLKHFKKYVTEVLSYNISKSN